MGRLPPLFTIVTPTYNHARFVGQCIDSVLAQTEPRWEQIVVDDGSTDGTEDIVREYADHRIRYLGEEHRGIYALSQTYNRALELARGEFVVVLEGDDLWPPNKLAFQRRMFSDADVVLSWGRAGVIDGAGNVTRYLPRSRPFRGSQRESRASVTKSLLRTNYIPACTVMCRRAALETIGGFRQPVGLPNVDYPTWIELHRAGRFTSTDQILGYWRQHDTQVTELMSDEMQRNGAWITDYLGALSDFELAEMGISRRQANRIGSARTSELSLWQGRAALKNGAQEEARTLFSNAIRRGSVGTRGQALFGVVCQRFGIDMEKAVGRLTGSWPMTRYGDSEGPTSER